MPLTGPPRPLNFIFWRASGFRRQRNPQYKPDAMNELAAQLRTITQDDAFADYEALCATDPETIKHTSNKGNRAADYFFFAHRIQTKTRKGISFPEWLQTNECEKPYYDKLIKHIVSKGNSLLYAKFRAFGLYSGSGTISAFKPLIARWLYAKYSPTTILDFSAGWGGRCLAAMSLDINYIGFDTNTALTSSYNEMINTYPHESKTEIIFADSSAIDYSAYEYDMVFTSPPYFVKNAPTERYENMPHYENKDDFNQRFFFPVVQKTFKHLKRGGIYALNIPIAMYEDIQPILGACTEKHPLVLANRCMKKKEFGGEYKEYIYVWRKN